MTKIFKLPMLIAGMSLGVLSAFAQNPAPAPQGVVPPAVKRGLDESIPPSISLSPAVVMARGSFGQGLTQTLTLANKTGTEFAFEMEAQDVVIKDGKRTFVPAGETEHSIAVTAVFSQKVVVVKPNSSISVDVRLTIPAETPLRAVVAVFKGTNKIQSSASAVGMTASLGALITFNLTPNIKLQPEEVHVTPATDTANLTISQWIANAGTEPVLPEGLAAVLNAKGGLVGKSNFESKRLLPGERLEFVAEYSDQLPPGDYKALCSFQFEGKTLTSDTTFKIP
ncbi:MAG TPA: hypothetical protein VNV88_10295 [Candidatus Solibacter sp.]|nr:hypothetical protein [Candidatus Solibacter sp.]